MLDTGIIVIYLLIILGFGIYKGLNNKTIQEFSIANKQYSTPVIVAALSASMIGGFATFGIASHVFQVGIVYILVATGMSCNLFLVATFIAPKFIRFQNCISVGEVIKQMYGKYAQIITGIAVVLISIGGTATQVSAVGYIFTFFLGIPYIFGVILACGVVVIYSSFGGIKSITATDVVQFAIIIIVIPVICNVALSKVGGYSALISALPAGHLTLFPDENSNVKYLFLFLTFVISFFEPIFIQRLLMSKNTNQAITSSKITAGVTFVYFIMIGIIGLVAYVLNSNIEPNYALPYIVNELLPIGVKGVAICGLLAIMMTTSDANLNVAGVALIHDVLKPLNPKISAKKELVLTKIFTFIIGSATIFLALKFHNLITILLYAFYFWVPIVVVPLIAGLFNIHASPKAFFASAFSGLIVFVLWKMFSLDLIWGFDLIIPGLVVNVVVFSVIYYYENTSMKAKQLQKI
jgi:SSS family solute:Na+ symporter